MKTALFVVVAATAAAAMACGRSVPKSPCPAATPGSLIPPILHTAFQSSVMGSEQNPVAMQICQWIDITGDGTLDYMCSRSDLVHGCYINCVYVNSGTELQLAGNGTIEGLVEYCGILSGF